MAHVSDLLKLLPLDGTRKMTDDLYFHNDIRLHIYPTAYNQVAFLNYAGTSVKSFNMYNAYIRAINAASSAHDVPFRVYDSTPAIQEIAKMVHGVAYRFEISKAGDIIPSDGLRELGSATNKWKNIYCSNYLMGKILRFPVETLPVASEGDVKYDAATHKLAVHTVGAWETITSA